MVSLEQLISWKPAELSAAADKLNSDRSQLISVQGDLDGGRPPSSWSGDSAGEAANSHARLVAGIDDIVASFSPAIAALDTAATAIESARSEAMAAKSAIAGMGWTLHTNGEHARVTPPPGKKKGLLFGVEQAAANALAQQIEAALKKAEAADTALAGTLHAGKAGKFDGGTGSLSSAALPPELRGLSDSQLYAAMLKDPKKYADYTDALTSAQQQGLGRALAHEYDAIDDFNTVNGRDHLPIDDARARQLTAMLNAYGKDSTVSTAMMNQLGPDKLLNIQENMLSWTRGDHPLDPDVIGASQRAFGQALASATHGTASDTDRGNSEHLSAAFVKGLIDHGGQEYNIDQWGTTVKGYELLGPLLRDKGHSSYFLNEVGDHMEAYEKQYLKDNDGQSPWDQGESSNQIDFTHGAMDHYVKVDGHDVANLPTGHDPFGGLMEGLSHNPDAARQFFSDTHQTYGDRIAHYLGRDWPHNAAVTDDLPSSKRYFADALTSATTVEPNATSADLMERSVHDAAVMKGGLPDDMRATYGRMLSTYMPDVYGSLSGYDNSNPYSDGDPYVSGHQDPKLHAHFDEVELSRVMGRVGSDHEAGGNLVTAAGDYANRAYDHYLTGGGDTSALAGMTDQQRLEERSDLARNEVNQPYAKIVGSTGEGYAHQLHLDQEERDKAASGKGDDVASVLGWVASKGVDSTVGLVPVVGSAGADGINHFIGEGVDDAKAGHVVDTSQAVRDRVGVELSNEYSAGGAMAQSAVYRHIPAADLPSDLRDQHGHPIPMAEWTDRQVSAWQSMAQQTGPGSVAAGLADDLRQQLSIAAHDNEQYQGHR